MSPNQNVKDVTADFDSLFQAKLEKMLKKLSSFGGKKRGLAGTGFSLIPY